MRGVCRSGTFQKSVSANSTDVIEPTFAWAFINRPLARDVERAPDTVKAFLQIAMIKLMARRIARFSHFLVRSQGLP